MRKTAIVLVVVLCLSVFAGCTGNTGQDQTSAPPVTTSKDPVKLTFWYSANDGNPALMKWFDETINMYKQSNTNTTVDVMNISDGNQYLTKITTEVAANNTPDVFMTWVGGRLEPFVTAGRLTPLDDIIEGDAELKNVVAPNSIKLTSFNDKCYAIPLTPQSEVIFYNKKIFSELNLTIPDTYDDLVAIADKINAETDLIPMVMGNADLWLGTIPYMTIFNRLHGNELYQKVVMEKTALFDDPAFAEAGEILYDMVEKGIVNENCNGLKNAEAQSIFKTGGAAMNFDGSWRVSSYYPELGDDLDFFNFPDIPGGKGSKDSWIANYGNAFSISSSTKNPDAAIDIFKFLFSKARLKALGDSGDLIAMQNIDLDESKLLPINLKIQESVLNSKYPIYVWDVMLGTNLGTELNKTTQAILGGEDPVKMFGALQKIAEAEWGD
jgi:raffinose/stachyose/melibiose transport system substrate-binding protein